MEEYGDRVCERCDPIMFLSDKIHAMVELVGGVGVPYSFFSSGAYATPPLELHIM